MQSKLFEYVINSSKRLAMLVGINFGIPLVDTAASEVFSDVETQVKAILAINEHFKTNFLLSAMDLSVEAECFGSQIEYTKGEIPVVVNPILTNSNEIAELRIPQVGEKRTQMYLDIMNEVVSLKPDQPIIGGIIGPFSLAGRLYGVSEMLELTITDPDLAKLLLEKISEFLLSYIQAYKATRIEGVIMAEPVAGLLSPKSMLMFSSLYIKRIIKTVESNDFSVIYHNCGAKSVHLASVFRACASIYHFGAPMDLSEALIASKGERIIAGNLNPSTVFLADDKNIIAKKTLEVLNSSKGYRNFVISSGCDLPPNTPLGNVEMFLKTVENNSQLI
jgi:uroporphyrinogen decarboxylase